MSSLSRSSPVDPPAGRSFLPRVSSWLSRSLVGILDRAESLKWLGLFCMTVDHLGKFTSWRFSFSHPVGRFTAPLFFVAASAQLCRPGVPARVFRRLAVSAVLVFPFFFLVCHEHILPVLWTIGCGALLWQSSKLPFRRAALWVPSLTVLSCFGEYSVFGAFYLAGVGRLLSRDFSPGAFAWAFAGFLGQWFTEGPWQALACVVAPVLLFVLPRVRRVRHVFLFYYLVQWPVFLAASLV